jgi:sulfite reductase (NADPH) hemoprotein beta-component
MPSVVTANVLRTGAIVYLQSDGTWVGKLAEATVAGDAAARATLEKLALSGVERGEVTAVYAFDVGIVDGRPEPLSVRERIRAAGTPTV